VVSRREADGAVIEGVRPVIEALRAGRRRVRELQLPREREGPNDPTLLELARRAGVRVVDALPGTGVRALADPYPEVAFEELLSGPPPRRLVALDGVTDVGNLGSIARSAEVAGIGGLVLEARRAPPINAGALRASAGALEHLQVARAPNLRRALLLARQEGLEVFAADVGGIPPADLEPGRARGEWILLLGSEDRGIRPALRELADVRLGIPMRGRIGSLGVAAAAAYLLLRLAEPRVERATVLPGPDLVEG
jgi:23S rRNA (guanosine2251-2'-O)-methyltransferase